ncbi:MAG TPA: glucokinase [Aestuariivirgaceae bacterium]|nr:glucokinase [Aestuariivirgaceae bacterium]
MSPAPMADPSYPILVADIGGTNARFGLVRQANALPTDVRTLACADHPSLEAAMAAYLALAGDPRPPLGCIDVAGPVFPGRFQLTNRPQWNTEIEPVRRAFGFDMFAVINDFEALAEAVPLLAGDELIPIGDRLERDPEAPIAVIGPGTGLGVGAAVKTPFGWQALPGEGGHMEIGHPDPRCRAVIDLVARKVERVSAERLLSGPGLELLHVALGEVDGEPRDGQGAADISARAHRGDAAAADTVLVFFDILASFCGDVALLMGAKGGVFVGGGVALSLRSLLDPARFRAAFERKGRLRSYMERIPTSLIAADMAALRGCGARIERLARQRRERSR